MIHDLTWLGWTRGVRRKRLTATLGLLLACILFAGLPAVASATPTEMRGEWEVTVTTGGKNVVGKGRITEEANAKSEFATSSISFEEVAGGSFSGTLNGNATFVKVIIDAVGPFPEAVFTSNTMNIETVSGKLTISGSGTVTEGGGSPAPGSVVATQIKTQQQIEEREAIEKREREEKEARKYIQGEWELTLEGGPQPIKGIAVIAEEANAKNEFASASAQFAGIPGTFSGALKGAEASVTITTQGAGSIPPGSFTSTTIALSSAAHPISMTGAGTLKFGPTELPGTLNATRIRSHQQIVEQEAAELQAKEAKEKQEKEAVEKAARELNERQEREAQEKAAFKLPMKAPPPIVGVTPPLVSVFPAGKALTASGAAISLTLTNPNPNPAHGLLKLTFTSTTSGAKHAKAHAKRKTVTLGQASFSIVAGGNEVVKLSLTKTGRAELAHLKTIRALVTLTTQMSGQPTATKTYSLTLHSGSSKRKG